MPTIDQRTSRYDSIRTLDVAAFLSEELPSRLADTGSLAAGGIEALGLPPLTLAIDGATFSLEREGATLRCREGPASGALFATLDRQSASELLQDQASTFGLLFDGRAHVSQPDRDGWLLWEPALRAALDGRPVYEPGSVSLRDRDGGELDLRQHFDLMGPLDDAGHFLAEAGFLHLPGVFSTSEMAAVAEDLVVCSAAAGPDDGDSWWAETSDGPYPSRILRFAEKSPTLHGLLVSDRFQRIRSLVDDALDDTAPSAEGLHKKVGVKKGISDVSWHKDCSLGGHSRVCSTMVVGISITGAGAVNGELGVVAGSNRANVPPIGASPSLDLPRIALPTETGDLTIHCSCTLHMSRPPVSRPRMVAYSGFGLAPVPGDTPPIADAGEEHEARARTGGQQENLEGMTIADHELAEA